MRKQTVLLLVFTGLFSISAQEDINLKIDELVAPLVATNNFSGTIAIAKNGEMVMQKEYGEAVREYGVAHEPESKFYLASVSMIFTAAAVMKLRDEGKLKLDDPIGMYFPLYKNGETITIHHMLAQRSGIPAIGYNGSIDYNRMTKFAHSADSLFTYFQDYELLFEPGEKYNHGRSEYILLARLVEKLSGLPFGEYLRQEIFQPLNMNNTGHDPGDNQFIPKMAQGYAPAAAVSIERAPTLNWSSKTGHASIYSTTGDLLKFGKAALEKSILSAESWDKIFTDYGQQVGYGWFIRPHLGRERYQMNGRSPGYSSYLAIYPEEELVLAVLSNMYISLAANIGLDVAAIVLDEPYEPLPLSAEKINREEVAAFLGKYQFGPDFYRPNFLLEISYENGYLSTPWGWMIPVVRDNQSIRAFVLRPFWSYLEFKKDPDKGKWELKFDRFLGTKI